MTQPIIYIGLRLSLYEDAQLKPRHFEVEVDMDLMKVLYEQAQQKRVGISQLVNEMLREQLRHVA